MSDGAVRGVIALAAVPGSIVLMGIVWILKGEAAADSVARVLQGVMLTVVGFYFGGLGAERAEQRARSMQEEADRLRTASAVTAEATDDAEQRLQKMLAVLDRLGEDETMRRKIEDLLEEVDG